MNQIEVKGLCKTFGTTKALCDVSLKLEEGKIYGLLGRNGAGKSTLLNILTNRLFADAGTVLVNGVKAEENDNAQQKMFLMSEKSYYPESFRVSDIFRWTKEFYGAFDMEEAMRLSAAFGLDTKKRFRKLSTGYQSIAKIVTALSLYCPYILLDEPVLGLDANHRDLFYKLLLRSYAEHPRTMVISTHLIEESARLLEDVIVIKNGEIIETGPVEYLLGSGYSAAGAAEHVRRFTAGKTVIGAESLGGLQVAYIRGKRPEKVPAEIELGAMDLQKLFIQLTNA